MQRMALNLMIGDPDYDWFGAAFLGAIAWCVLCGWGLENGHDWLCFGSAGIFIVGALFMVIFGDGD